MFDFLIFAGQPNNVLAKTFSPYCILTSESLVLALQNARPAVERNYQVAISWSRHVQPRTKHSDFREIVIKVTSVRGPRSRSHAVNAIYCFSLVNAGATGSHRTTCNRR